MQNFRARLFTGIAAVLLGGVVDLGAVGLIDRPTEGRQYETLRFRFEESLGFANPFDLETNRVELLIQQPDFTRRTLSFFYDGQNAEGVEQWEARFAPKQAGRHRFHVRINGKSEAPFEVMVKANPGKRGGLRRAPQLGIFELENGEPFRGLGLNICWADDYEYYFKKMQAAGLNLTRLWMCPWHLSFEWKETGLGRYNLDSARRLDMLLALADKYGIYLILCMDYHGIARKGLGFFKENRWLENPYNQANGGPCATDAELFTNTAAREFFKRKYKYLVSRFGHSSRLATWEFYNEADLMAGQSIPVNRWHVEMAEYVQAIDVHDRLVSSSSTRSYPEKLVDAFKSPALDYVMFHDYNSVNVAPHFIDLHEATIEYYHKPVVLGEFGVEFRGADRTFAIDPQHIGLHNGIWSGWFSETPIIPMTWWWDNYIDPHNLWREFASLSRFAQALPIDQQHLVFKTLAAGRLTAQPEEQAACLVRIIYSGEHCALWFKNMDYQWSLVQEGKQPGALGAFTQIIPELTPGPYTVAWYDPQTGAFMGKPIEMEADAAGTLALPVPSFVKDLAVVVTRRR